MRRCRRRCRRRLLISQNLGMPDILRFIVTISIFLVAHTMHVQLIGPSFLLLLSVIHKEKRETKREKKIRYCALEPDQKFILHMVGQPELLI